VPRLGTGPAARSERSHRALRLAGFVAPEIVARGQLPGGREYLFSRALEGEPLQAWLRNTLAGTDPATLRLRWSLLRELGTLVGRLHTSGFLHGKLTAHNILVAYRGGRFHFALTGNERGRLRRPPPGRGLLADLGNLCRSLAGELSRTDLWRCFLAWRQQHPELGHLEARLLAQAAWQRGRSGL